MDTEMALKMRVKLCMEKLKVSANEMERQCGISHSTISSQVNGKSKLSATVIAELLSCRPDISAEWIFRGTGDMLNKQADTIIIHNDASGDSVRMGNITGDHNIVGSHNGAVPTSGTNTMQDDYKCLLVEKDKQIADLRKDKENLMQLLTNLTAKL